MYSNTIMHAQEVLPLVNGREMVQPCGLGVYMYMYTVVYIIRWADMYKWCIYKFYCHVRYYLQVSPLLELFLLGIMSIRIILEIKWFGAKRFVTHKRSMLKTIVLVVMIVWSIVVLGTGIVAHRYIRSLRPIFLLDFLIGVRRWETAGLQ